MAEILTDNFILLVNRQTSQIKTPHIIEEMEAILSGPVTGVKEWREY